MMAQSTEDYLDSLLRQAMGISEPEPEVKPDNTPELGRDDVLAMADGLTGSNSAILGNAYDHNASFTNQGEIEMTAAQAAAPATSMPAPEETVIPEIAAEDLPDPDAPASSGPAIFDTVIPEFEPVAETEETEPVSIPEGPVIEHDEGNLDILPEPANLSEGLFLDNLPLEEAIIEDPIIEEPIAEAPIIEEPVIEAPTIEEPFMEEPAIEEPIIEEPVIEEPVIEEPIIEESVIEEPVVEESVIEEPVAEDEFGIGDSDSGLEALEIPFEEEAPLMPDQEISDLLSTLGELTGENAEPEEEAPPVELPESLIGGDSEEPVEEPAEGPAEEPIEDQIDTIGFEDFALDDNQSESADEAVEASTEAPETGDMDLGGIDLLNTDLSAMLDDVTSSLDAEEAGEAAVTGDDTDLNDLLGSLDDGSGELSDIGDLLNKDENSELVDPNTETAEALFASDSEEDIFNIDNLIEEDDKPKGRRKKKKFGLFGKKNKGDGDIEIIGGDEEMLIDPDLLDIPEEQPKEKKPGFFAALLAKLFEEVGEEEPETSAIEQSAVEIAQEGAAENEAILSELETEEEIEAKKKKGKKEKKKKEKKDKKGKKSGGEEGEDEEAAEDTKKKKKKEKKKKEKLPEIPGKKLPRKKVVAITLFCITIGIVTTLLAFFIPYSQDIKKAKKYYTTGEYQKTYEYMRGHKLTEDDKVLYNRTVTLLRIKRPYDSYQNYMKMGLRMEALNALVQGVQMSDRYAEDAANLGIIDKYSKQSRLIYDELYNTFGVTVDKARTWIQLEGSPEYTRALYEALLGTSGGADSVEGDSEDININVEEFDDAFEEPDDSVINAEENDL